MNNKLEYYNPIILFIGMILTTFAAGIFGYLMGKQSLEHLSGFKHLLFYQLTSKFCYFDLLLMKEEEMKDFIKLEHSFFISKTPNKALQRAAKVFAEL